MRKGYLGQIFKIANNLNESKDLNIIKYFKGKFLIHNLSLKLNIFRFFRLERIQRNYS